MTADGGWIAGGPFTSVEGQPRTSLARFAADGTLVAGWNPHLAGTSVSVWAIATDATGNLYVGGSFDSIDGVPRANLARLKPDGSVDANWRADTNDAVYRLVTSGNGPVFVAGAFQTIGGRTHPNLTKLSPVDGTVDVAWDPSLQLTYAMVLGHAVNSLVRVSATTGNLDTSWVPQAAARMYVVPSTQQDIFTQAALSPSRRPAALPAY